MHDKHYQSTISINLSRAISKHFNSIKSQLFCVQKNVRRHENKAKRAICYNGLRLAAVGDFGALHCQPEQQFDRSTRLQFCTSPPIEATRC